MSLVSTIAELREWANDGSWSGPTDQDEFLSSVADELSEYAEDLWLVVFGSAKNQKVLDAAVDRLQAAIVDD